MAKSHHHMPRLRWIHHGKLVLTAGLIVAACAAVAWLMWENQRGFGGEWGDRIEEELARRGIHAEFTSVRFSPLRGVIAKDVTVFLDESPKRVFAHIPVLRIDLDRRRALRGEVVLRDLTLHHATLLIPLGSTSPEAEIVKLEDLTSHVSIDREGHLSLKEARGRLSGMPFRLTVELGSFDLAHLAKRPPKEDRSARSEFLEAFLEELSLWWFPDSEPPEIALDIRGSLQRPDSIRSKFTVEATQVSRNNYPMEHLSLKGEFRDYLVTIDDCGFTNGAGRFRGSGDYDTNRRHGRYDFESDIHLNRFLSNCFGVTTFERIQSVQAPNMSGTGEFHRDANGKLSVRGTGSVSLPSFRIAGFGPPFEGLETDYAWQDGKLFLQNLQVMHENGSLTGKILLQDPDIRFQVDSSLPVSAYTQFFKQEGGLIRTISQAAFGDRSSVRIKVANGNIDWRDLKTWNAKGEAEITNVTYRGVPLARAAASFEVSPLGSEYTGIEATFDYRNDETARRFGGPETGAVRAESIVWDSDQRLTTISKLTGTAWPAPLLGLFSPRTAAHVSNNYRFRQPPRFEANGVIDANRPQVRSKVTTTISSGDVMNYTFLGKEIAIRSPSARIVNRHQRVDVLDMKGRLFEGDFGGDLTVRRAPDQSSTYSGGVKWTDLRLRDIGQTYGFGKAEHGYLTGRFDFTGSKGSTRSLEGRGNIALKQGDLFYVPVLGPLSPIFGEVLGDKSLTHEQARDASASFVVQKGVMFTRDFLTSTPSTVFTGEGNIDLSERTIDMIVRMNARGLLGLITLPLRPFNGLFQFQGRGALQRPTWSNAPFTEPSQGKNDPIFRKPSRAVEVAPDRRGAP